MRCLSQGSRGQEVGQGEQSCHICSDSAFCLLWKKESGMSLTIYKNPTLKIIKIKILPGLALNCDLPNLSLPDN
jgi:hypothetical protein